MIKKYEKNWFLILKELKVILQVLFDRYFIIKMKTELFFKILTFNWLTDVLYKINEILLLAF